MTFVNNKMMVWKKLLRDRDVQGMKRLFCDPDLRNSCREFMFMETHYIEEVGDSVCDECVHLTPLGKIMMDLDYEMFAAYLCHDQDLSAVHYRLVMRDRYSWDKLVIERTLPEALVSCMRGRIQGSSNKTPSVLPFPMKAMLAHFVHVHGIEPILPHLPRLFRALTPSLITEVNTWLDINSA
jgi:hypothetical protein